VDTKSSEARYNAALKAMSRCAVSATKDMINNNPTSSLMTGAINSLLKTMSSGAAVGALFSYSVVVGGESASASSSRKDER
jgi:hypothetical protein